MLSLHQLALDLFLPVGVHLHLGRLQGGHSHEFEVRISDEFACQPQERFLEVVVGLCADVVVLLTGESDSYRLMTWTINKFQPIYLQVLLPVEDDGLGLHLTVLDVYLVAAEDNRDVLTDSNQVTMPVGHIFVGDTGGDVKHDDGTLALKMKEKPIC